MRKFILSSLELTSQIAIFLILLSGLVNGAIGGGFRGIGGAVTGGAIGFLVALVFCVVVFGALYLLMEIAENTRRTAESIEAMRERRYD
ncbi:MAG: hypothetical protein QNJ11_13735 [Woeseiaceae bacterium]|nr:hypothetical protein [Woeseiaceae bacterium]